VTLPTEMAQRLAEIRRAFDESFAAPPRERGEQHTSLLIVRAAERRFAVRLDALAGIEHAPAIVPIPGGAPSLLGIVGIRGRLFAVYPLEAFLGWPSSQGARRWLLLTASDQGVAFAVDALEGFVQASAADLVPAGDGRMGEHVHEALRDGSTLRPVASVSSLLAAVEQHARTSISSPTTSKGT
jgi:chemotaxis signal transduction protein